MQTSLPHAALQDSKVHLHTRDIFTPHLAPQPRHAAVARTPVALQHTQAGARLRLPRDRIPAAARKHVVQSSTVSDAPKLFTKVSKGEPEPLGPSQQPEGVNFALFSRHAAAVTLVLRIEARRETVEVPLDASTHRTGDVWHVMLEGLPGQGVLYGFR